MTDRRGLSPTVRRRRVAAEMRELRRTSGMSAADVAAALGWSESKVLYIESGKGVRPNPRDIEDLCEKVYKVTDERRDYYVKLARDGRLKGWWQSYDKMLSRPYTTYIGLEAEVSVIASFEAMVIPGLLQTPDYARALFAGSVPSLKDVEIDDLITVRMQRQQILRASDPAHLHSVVDEGAIRRIVGGPDVMRAQLKRLLELAERPNITLQVMPFDAATHPALAGSFTVLQFADAADAPAVYIETMSGELFIEEGVEQYTAAFDRLRETALSPKDTIAVIAAVTATI
ncbi:helix-turn-helix transcriptional regulator [Actinoallomurus sp. NPDC052308]|uniref:helix-turn-helix domain-containing protein n=1 Tax=Actinoallomurus sp. NPDC052308 TaxID=3155530 RepID=UPI00343C07F8